MNAATGDGKGGEGGDQRPDPAPYYRRHVFCCINQRPKGHAKGCCFDGGSVGLRNHMKDRAKEMGLTDVRVNASGCLDRCELGPVLVIYPEGVWYRVNNEADVEEILATHVRDGGRVPRLMLAPDETPES